MVNVLTGLQKYYIVYKCMCIIPCERFIKNASICVFARRNRFYSKSPALVCDANNIKEFHGLTFIRRQLLTYISNWTNVI